MGRNADDKRPSKIGLKAPHGIPKVLEKGPPVDLFEHSFMSNLAFFCKLSVAYCGCVLIFAPMDNWMSC